MGQTTAEKIFSAHTGHEVYAGQRCFYSPDLCFCQDQTAPEVLDRFELLGLPVKKSLRFFLGIDHNSPAPDTVRASVHCRMRKFAADCSAKLFDIDRGIVHHVLIDSGLIRPGFLVTGSDRHASVCGAVGALGMSISPADLVLTMVKGKNCMTVPQTVKIVLKGKPEPGVFAQDIMLWLISFFSEKGCRGKVLEFSGKAVNGFSPAARFTFAAMSAESGAVCGLLPADKKMFSFLEKTGCTDLNPISPDPDCKYAAVHEFDLSSCRPCISGPYSLDRVFTPEEMKGVSFAQGFIGSAANGRLEDLQIAARILEGKKISSRVKLFIAPASKNVFYSALKKGIIKKLAEAGAVILPVGCGPSSGTHLGVPADGEKVLSTGPVNFKGSMGNPESEVYLASPATVAASCLQGAVQSPRKFLK